MNRKDKMERRSKIPILIKSRNLKEASASEKNENYLKHFTTLEAPNSSETVLSNLSDDALKLAKCHLLQTKCNSNDPQPPNFSKTVARTQHLRNEEECLNETVFFKGSDINVKCKVNIKDSANSSIQKNKVLTLAQTQNLGNQKSLSNKNKCCKNNDKVFYRDIKHIKNGKLDKIEASKVIQNHKACLVNKTETKKIKVKEILKNINRKENTNTKMQPATEQENTELKEFEILEQLCSKNQEFIAKNGESDINGDENNLNEVDFVKVQNLKIPENLDYSDTINKINVAKQKSVIPETCEINVSSVPVDEQKFLEVISEECSGDFEKFETPPTSIESIVSNTSTFEDTESEEYSVQENMEPDSKGSHHLQTLCSGSNPGESFPALLGDEKRKLINSECTSTSFEAQSTLSLSYTEPSALTLTVEPLAASRVSLEPAGPLIDVATLPNSCATPPTTCSRDSAVATVSSPQQEVRYGSGKFQKPADINSDHLNLVSHTQNFDKNNSKSCELSTSSVTNCTQTQNCKNILTSADDNIDSVSNTQNIEKNNFELNNLFSAEQELKQLLCHKNDIVNVAESANGNPSKLTLPCDLQNSTSSKLNENLSDNIQEYLIENSKNPKGQNPAKPQITDDNNLSIPIVKHHTQNSGSCILKSSDLNNSSNSDFKCAKADIDNSDYQSTKRDGKSNALCWGFKNGRLVFGEANDELKQVVEISSSQKNNNKLIKEHNLLTSKNLNRKRIKDSKLRLLETKLTNSVISDRNPESKLYNCTEVAQDLKHIRAQKCKLVQKIDKEKNIAQESENKHVSQNCNLKENIPNDSGLKVINFFENHTYLAQNEFCESKNNLKSDNIGLDKQKAKFINYNEFQNGSLVEKKLDSNQNEVENKKFSSQEEDLIPDYNFLPENSHIFSEFNSSKFPCNINNVYREFLEDSSSDSCSSVCSCNSEDSQEHYIVISRKNSKNSVRMRGDGSTMSDSETKVHNPDKNNLKSLLKRSGIRKKDRHKNKVIFNENKNEFFDADYIILIREECDYDEEDDDGICTCNQHEMVRLTCCEPNCNCQFDGYDQQTPPSPKFAPPIEFVDAITLSPPEGYKDMELGEDQLLALQQMARSRGQPKGVVCRECSASHDGQIEEEGECSLSEEGEAEGNCPVSASPQTKEEKEKTDQSQQTTPTTPPCSDPPADHHRHILNPIVTSSSKHSEDDRRSASVRQPSGGSPISGILKGGRLWKQSSSTESNSCGVAKGGEQASNNVPPCDAIVSDDESGSKRSVRFVETVEPNVERRDVCDGAPQLTMDEEIASIQSEQIIPESNKTGNSPESTEMTLTFKLANHVLVSNNSLKPNSAVRQLFPNTKALPTEVEETSQQYLVTAESLRAFEDSKRSKLPQVVQSTDFESMEEAQGFKRAIERNTLRRSLIRYEPRSKKQPYKTDNSLVERIKQLTCLDDNLNASVESDQQTDTSSTTDHGEDVLDSRVSPPGEEARNSPDVNTLSAKSQMPEKSFSPSSSSTISSSSSSIASLHPSQRSDNIPDIQNTSFRREAKSLPDIGGPHHPSDPHAPQYYVTTHHPHHQPLDHTHCAITNKMSSSSNSSESRRQFLSTLAPLTACVMGTTGAGHAGEDYYYSLSNQQPGERVSMASSIGTEYSLEDIDEALKNSQEQLDDEQHRKIAPDVLVGTPSASESGDELAMFVQQDMNRIERIKKKYQPEKDEDDEHDDYGFNRRPSVRGIKPRFGTTTEILQQIQNQLQPLPPPQAKASNWPYYSESNLSTQKNNANNPPPSYYANLPPEETAKSRSYAQGVQYRPTSLQDQESLYQNCTNQRCGSRQEQLYHSTTRNVNIYQQTVVRVGNEYYQSLPRQRNGRPQSPPPMEMAKSCHQTMVYIPYNHIEAGYQPRYNQYSVQPEYVSRVSSQNQINRRYPEPIYPKPHEYNQNMIPPLPPKLRTSQVYPPQPHSLGGSRSESPVPGQFSTARSTQTGHPVMQQCASGYYPSVNPRYRPMINPIWPGDGTYSTKMNRHSYPARLQDSSSLSTDSDSTSHSGSIPNGYNRASADMSNYAVINPMASPTKSRFIERGVPEGAASVSPQDLNSAGGGNQTTSGTMTSPTSPQNPTPMPPGQKPLFYAMNV